MQILSYGECPTGIATMDPMRYRAIDIEDRSERAYNFHKNTIFVLKELLNLLELLIQKILIEGTLLEDFLKAKLDLQIKFIQELKKVNF